MALGNVTISCAGWLGEGVCCRFLHGHEGDCEPDNRPKRRLDRVIWHVYSDCGWFESGFWNAERRPHGAKHSRADGLASLRTVRATSQANGIGLIRVTVWKKVRP
jgi:hypothetical protein